MTSRKMNSKSNKPESNLPYPVLESHLRCLKLPAMLSEYSQSARRCSADNAGYEKYLEELTAIEVGKRESN